MRLGGAGAIPETARRSAAREEATSRSGASSDPRPGGEAGAGAGTAHEGTWARLERLVQTLVERYRALRAERDALRREIAEREERIRSLDARLTELAHSREEAAKRLDHLLERVDRLDAEMASGAASPAASARD